MLYRSSEAFLPSLFVPLNWWSEGGNPTTSLPRNSTTTELLHTCHSLSLLTLWLRVTFVNSRAWHSFWTVVNNHHISTNFPECLLSTFLLQHFLSLFFIVFCGFYWLRFWDLFLCLIMLVKFSNWYKGHIFRYFASCSLVHTWAGWLKGSQFNWNSLLLVPNPQLKALHSCHWRKC